MIRWARRTLATIKGTLVWLFAYSVGDTVRCDRAELDLAAMMSILERLVRGRPAAPSALSIHSRADLTGIANVPTQLYTADKNGLASRDCNASPPVAKGGQP